MPQIENVTQITLKAKQALLDEHTRLTGYHRKSAVRFLNAWKLDDSMARDQGRIALNPLRPIDLSGFVFLVFAGFGWAKPIQFNPACPRRP
jgi:hypothetical protein